MFKAQCAGHVHIHVIAVAGVGLLPPSGVWGDTAGRLMPVEGEMVKDWLA